MTNVDEYQTGREVYLFDVLRVKAEIAAAKAENREPDLDFPRGISDPLEFARINAKRLSMKFEEADPEARGQEPEEDAQEPQDEDESDEEPDEGTEVAPGVVIS